MKPKVTSNEMGNVGPIVAAKTKYSELDLGARLNAERVAKGGHFYAVYLRNPDFLRAMHPGIFDIEMDTVQPSEGGANA